MSQDIFKRCESCYLCNYKRPRHPDTRGILSSTPATRPFERLSVDLIKLPRSKLGNGYAVVFIDLFTCWLEAKPVPDKKATTINRVMNEYIFARHGIPNYLLWDEGSEFLNQLVAEVCKLYGATILFSAAFHSRNHGMVERLNRTIEDRLKHTNNQYCDDWDVWLLEALFAIRSTPASGTKMSSFCLLYGRDPILPIDNALLYPQTSSSMAQARQIARLLTRLTTPARPLHGLLL
jgi:transposase InsO family protein